MAHNPPCYSSTSTNPNLRTSSFGMFSSQQHHSPALAQRISEKKQELENLIQLRDLSAALAQQMEMLEEKLGTLADGTEAVAHILANWQNVLRAISMASTPLSRLQNPAADKDPFTSQQEPPPETTEEQQAKIPMPITLVRIPTQHYQNIAIPP
ncbi:DASH complex subunit Dad2-domain-containing protein [Tirmania nivea]|nr:DASH complex subunit Dad2-domain-containing protein [Tirmania nivea]